MTLIMTRQMAEEMGERMRMALAEAGFPGVQVHTERIDENWDKVQGWTPTVVPFEGEGAPRAAHNAFRICLPPEFGNLMPCYDCWADDNLRHLGAGIIEDCMVGNCRNQKET